MPPSVLAAVTRRLEAVADFLFGYDFFISYAHADGKEYPRFLRRRLEELGYKTFLDEEGFVGGDDLNRATRRRVRMSSKLVLLARPHALTISPWVRQELSLFVESGGSPVVVNFDGAVEALPADSPIRPLVQGRLWFPETSSGAEDTQPSDRVVHEIVRTFDSTRQETVRLRILAIAALVFLATAVFAGWQWFNAEVRRRVSVAARLDAEAGRHFAQADAAATAWDRESARREDLHREIARWTSPVPQPASVVEGRLANLRQEVEEATRTMTERAADARTSRGLGRRKLGEADEAWRVASCLWKRAADGRVPLTVPELFSIEVLSVGFGESLILHYGDPDAPGFILIDGGQPQTYAKALRPRLAALRRTWKPKGPLPLDYLMISNQDDDRLGGIERLLRELRSQKKNAVAPRVEIGNLWFESFGPGYAGWPKALARLHIETLGIPLNKPFDGLVMRPQQGRVTVDLGRGLTATVLNPTFENVQELHRLWDKEAKKRGEERPRAPAESYGTARVSRDVAESPPLLRTAGCRDQSVPNRASLVLLFTFAGKTFLHGGDACAAQIEAGLHAAGLLGADGTASVDLMLVPHQGSDNNVYPDFFRRIKALHYLFTGDGTHNNPEEATLEMILEARRGETYWLQFVNRDGRPGFGEKLDAFFASRPSSVYGYRRVFRSGGSAAITVDLLDRVRY